MAQPVTLPQLPYAYDALEPVISKQIMELHHSGHHQAYVNNLNSLLAANAEATARNDFQAVFALQQKINFHGGGHVNHSLFWENLTPPGNEKNDMDRVAPLLKDAIVAQFGSVDAFKRTFSKKLLDIQGSGWGWLACSGGPEGPLTILTTQDQDTVGPEFVPIFGIDMWEHAYYIQVCIEAIEGLEMLLTDYPQYLNKKAIYVEKIWLVINWAEAEKRFTGGIGHVKL
ncbi:Superoxide dismutase [Penicillium argentinense]|uniref:Superoxide dismutase n=1 Tax=Penicillium argentinense TaxID=1131581 RepID=A0A9W9EIZ8_9EURO|nr:Superoxide dismutase [Penicillium argentinense]KAJ5082716.1 Superoxide dismutase [Penicillium argentinense]